MKAGQAIRRPKTDLNNYQLAAIAVFLVGRTTTAVHTEDVAIKAYEVAPHRFSWKKYDGRIDLEAVRVALRHASEPQYGALVAGSIETGWMLTPAGLAWAEKIAPQFEHFVTPQARRGSHQAAMQAERERLLQTNAWRKFRDGNIEEVTIHDFHSFARVNEYTSRIKYEERMSYLRMVSAGEPGLTTLVDYLDKKFHPGFGK
jgi:hypothetical protein